MNCGDTGRERRGGVALRATPHLMSEMLWRRFEKSLVQTCLLYRNLFTRAVFLPFRTGRIIQQLSEVTHAFPVGEQHFQNPVPGPLAECDVGQGHDCFPVRHAQTAHCALPASRTHARHAFAQSAGQVQLFKTFPAVSIVTVLIAHNGGNMAQQLRRLSLSVIQADAVGLVKMRSVLDDGDGQFPFFNRIFSVLLMDLR